VTARAHLRAGGLVYVAPDGVLDLPTVTVLLGGHRVVLGRGVATLARLTGAPAFPFAALWAGTRIELRLGPALEPPAAADPDAWEREWLTGYAAIAARWSRTPENLRANGGIYERLASSVRSS
jgi:hypothetical protein